MYFSKIELPHYRDETFEKYLCNAIDFKTKNPLMLREKDETSTRPKENNGYYVEQANEKYFFGSYESALRYYAYALKENPDEIDAWVGEVRVLVDCGEIDAAMFWADRGLIKFPDSEEIELIKAYTLVHAGQIEQARVLVNKPVRKQESPKIWLYRGEAILKMRPGFFQRLLKPYRAITRIGAFFCFMKALAFNLKDGFINQRIGIAYLKANNTKRAYDHLKTALSTAPHNGLTLYCLADCSRRCGDYQNALSYTKRAVGFNPELDAAMELMVRLHRPYEKFVCELKSIFRREKI